LAETIDSIGTSEFLPKILDYMRIDVPFVGVLLLIMDHDNRPIHIYDTIRSTYRMNLDMYMDGVYELDPFYTHFCKNKAMSTLLIRDVAPDRFQLTEYYRRYYKNIELKDEMAIFSDLKDGRFLFFSIGRRSKEPRFRRSELRAMMRNQTIVAALCHQHFSKSSYSTENLTGGDDRRIEFALERFGEEALSPREQEVALHILKGYSTKSIARELKLSPETVKIHRKNLYRKLDISTQSELFISFLNGLK
jgi:DNA-binding CsgD family transcriptional regulator